VKLHRENFHYAKARVQSQTFAGDHSTFEVLLGDCLVATSVFLLTELEAQHSDKYRTHK
jgi:hypothetical protein